MFYIFIKINIKIQTQCFQENIKNKVKLKDFF